MKKLFSLTLILLALCSLLCGCGEESPVEKVNIAFVFSVTENETTVNTGIAELSSLPASPGSHYAFIETDGDPYCVLDGKIPDLTDRGYSKEMMRRVQAGILADLQQCVESMTPGTGEKDMGKAFSLASRTLRANAESGVRNIMVVYGSGISTVGAINMVDKPVCYLDIESSVAALTAALPLDFSGVEVIWYCAGDAAGQQAKLNESERQTLREFYSLLLTEMGAESVTFMDRLPSAEAYSFALPVSLMEVEGCSSGLQGLSRSLLSEDTNIFRNPVAITEDQVRFIPDTDSYADTEAAEAVLTPLAAYLLRHTDLRLLLYGTCAGDHAGSGIRYLSKARAERVKSTLVAAGVADTRLVAVGLDPEDDPSYVYGLGTGSEAAVNRKTVILDLNSELAQTLLEKYTP